MEVVPSKPDSNRKLAGMSIGDGTAMAGWIVDIYTVA
jgi:hypothetical protein